MKLERKASESSYLKDGTAYRIRLLDETWIEPIHALHEKVLASLPPGDIFMAKKTPQDFKDHMRKGGIILGVIRDDGKLLGKALMTEPQSSSPDSLGLVSLIPSVLPGDFIVLQGSSVDPEHQGKGIGRILISARLARAAAKGIKHAFSEINVRNRNSLSALLANGMDVINAGLGLSTYQTTQFFHLHGNVGKVLTATFNEQPRPANAAHDVALDDLEKINALLLAGCRGVSYSRSDDRLHLESGPPKRHLIRAFKPLATTSSTAPAAVHKGPEKRLKCTH